jgi:hypothetical protein
MSSISLTFEHYRSWKDYDAYTFEDIEPIIESHAKSLVHLDMHWHLNKHDSDPENPSNIEEHLPMKLPRLPKLKTLSYISRDNQSATAQFFNPLRSILKV